MARTDLTADMFTMIRNAIMARKEAAAVPASKMNNAILGILKDEGYIDNFKEQVQLGASFATQRMLKVYLKYETHSKEPAIKGLRRVSRAGLRIYSKSAKIPTVLRGYGRAIVSTSQGLMTNLKAREKKLGGEIICYVW